MATSSRFVQAAKRFGRAIWTKVSSLVSGAQDPGASVAVKSEKRPWPLTPSAKAIVFALSVLSAVAAQAQTYNITLTLTVSPSTGVYAGEEVTLTATPLVNGSVCTLCIPVVEFFDSSVQPHLIGKAMLTDVVEANSNQGSVVVRFGAGTHSITAYLPTNPYNSNTVTSAPTAITVAPTPFPYSTATTLAAPTGTPGNYTLSATTSGFGVSKPTGTISFQDASNSNSLLGTGSLGSPSYNFRTGTPAGSLSNGANGIAVADFNNDGLPDFELLNSSGSATAYLSNGDGTFFGHSPISLGYTPAAVVAADPLGSGNLGFFVASTSPSQIQWFQGDGLGYFDPGSTNPLNHPSSQLIVGCAPGLWDGSVCSVSQSSGIIEMYFLGTTQTTEGEQPVATDLTFYAPASLNGVSGDWLSVNGISGNVVAADFKQNGILDLAYGNTSSKVVVVYPANSGTSVVTTSAVYPVGAPSVSIAAGDFNNDGYPDLAVVTQNNGLWIMLNNGSGGFSTPVGLFALPYPGTVVTGDFNHDGNLDLAIQQPGGPYPLLIYYGNGHGGFSPAAPQASVITNFNNDNGTIALGDFNGDGLPDLIATTSTTLNVQYSVMLGQQLETASASSIIAYGNGAQNADAVYTPGTADFWATSTSSTQPLQGIYATFAQPPPTSLAAGTAPGTIKVQATGNGSLVSGFTGGVQLTVVPPSGTSQVYTQIAVAGVATFSTVPALTQAGTYQYIANLTAGNSTSQSTANETVTAAAQSRLGFAPGVPNPSKAGTAETAKVAAQDAYGNTVPGFTGTVTLSSSDPAAAFSPATYTFVAADNGVHAFQVTFNTAGTQSLTAASSGLTSAVQSGIAVASNVPTTTYLGISASPITAKTVETLTASIETGSSPVGLGTVNFYDNLATPTLLGSAQVNSSGIALFRYRPSIGSHTVTATYTPAAGSTPPVGSDTLTLTFTPTDTTDYNNATATTTLTVTANSNPITPSILWPTPALMMNNTALSSTQLNAIALAGSTPLEGTFVYSPAAGTIPAIGLDTLTVTFNPTNSTAYTSATASVVLTVGDFFKMGCSAPTVCGSSPDQILQPGASVSYTLTVTPTSLSALPGELSFTTTGLPTGTTVTFSPSKIPAGSTATNVTITIQDNASQSANTRWQGRPPIALAMLLPMLGILSLRKRAGKMPQFRVMTALGILSLATLMGLAGCGGGFAVATPKCYTVVVTAQCGMLQHTTTAMIKVEN